ncbi:hypothetical protein TNCV_1920531 [Trichonephila clavipes]|nr:hypothetical protein TNCV_1920531 [Trichonephila clavipes]
MIYRSSPAVVVLGRPPPTFLTAVPVVWNAFPSARNDTFVDSELCSFTGDANQNACFMFELDEMFDDLRFAKGSLRKWMMETTAEFTEEEEKQWK